MGRSLVVETTFLVDLEREHTRGKAGGAIEFLETHPDVRLYVPFVVAGELASGKSMRERSKWEAFLGPFFVLPSTPEVCWRYGRAYRHLRDNGSLIGSNDLWIAATALANDMPLVTRNVADFRRVPSLEVLKY
jgi:tRNA(fMet)-specific endonuclease VapC